MEAVGVEAEHSGPSRHQPRFSAPFQLAIAFAISDLRRILCSNNIVTAEDEDAVGVGGVPEDDGQDVAFELGGCFDAFDVAGGESEACT